MKKIFAMLLPLFLMACSTVSTIKTDYAGADKGYVVVGMGADAKSINQSYTFVFRKSDDKSHPPVEAGQLTYFHSNYFSSQKKDYKNADEMGAIVSATLPPGRYEIFDFEIFLNMGTVQKTFRAAQPISIPFTVVPGKTVYLGNYQASDIKAKNIFGISIPNGAVFVVRDRQAADMELLRKRDPNVPTEVINTVPEVSKINSPAFVTQKPAQ